MNNLNEVTTVTRANTYTVAGSVSTNPTSVTVKDNANSAAAAEVYGDNAFARENITLLAGNNTFTAIAQDGLGRKDTLLYRVLTTKGILHWCRVREGELYITDHHPPNANPDYGKCREYYRP